MNLDNTIAIAFALGIAVLGLILIFISISLAWKARKNPDMGNTASGVGATILALVPAALAVAGTAVVVAGGLLTYFGIDAGN